MPVTQDELESFHGFASKKLADGDTDLSWVELFQLWQLEHPGAEERTEVNDIIRRGLEDIEAGRHRPVEEVMDELREKYDLPK